MGKTVGGKSPKFREYSQTISVNIYNVDSTYFGYCWLRKKVLTKKPTKNWNLQGSKLRGLNIHPSLLTLKWPAKFNLTISVYAARLFNDNLDNLDSAESDFIFAELHSRVYDSNNYQNQIFRCQVEILFR